jgi:hypothetical protein
MLVCKECGFELKFDKEIWMYKKQSYHPECVMDNKNLYALWKVAHEGDGR